jgi:hypothetical protein
MRDARERHDRAVRCDGRGWRDRRARRMRTAKSCGSGVAVLALRSGEAKLLRDNGGKRAVLRGEHEVSRKAIAQGRPGCSRCTCMLVCTSCQSANGTRDLGCSKHLVFPAPSDFRGTTKMQTSGDQRREIAASHSTVVVREEGRFRTKPRSNRAASSRKYQLVAASCATASYCSRRWCGENEAIFQRCR